MSDLSRKALLNAMASSSMEGLPIDLEKQNIIEKILDNEITLQDYFEHLKKRYAEQ